MQKTKVELEKNELESILSQLEKQRQIIAELSKNQQMLSDRLNALIEPINQPSKTSQSQVEDETSVESIAKDQKAQSQNILQLANLPFYKSFNATSSYSNLGLSKSKAEGLIKEFNSTSKKIYSNKSLNKIFEEVAEKNQDFPAIVYEEQFLSFGELNFQANQLANYMVARGLTEGEKVGIMLPRSLDMVVAILATLKAGCTYVPLPTNETARRLQYIIHNANLHSVITHSESASSYSILGDDLVKVIQLDIEKGGMTEMATENLDLTSSSNPVCILYSSSPISPVGTAINTKTVLNELNWFWNEYPYSNTEICCLTSRSTRAEFLNEFWGPLLKGIPNVFIPEKTLVDPPLLVEYLNDIRAQRLQLPPTILTLMLQSFPDLGSKLPLVKTWFLRGEQVHHEIIAQFRISAANKKIINLFNVTESGGLVAAFDLSDSQDSFKNNILGQPIYNTRIFLLDDEGFPVEPGEVGQILISSLGTESGYHNNTTITNNYFAKDKLSSKSNSNSKLFRTGDYGRINEEGQLEFLGRKDKHIKAYGRHLDLDSIAKVLRKQAQVKDAVIEASHNNRGQLAITAFLLVADQTYSVQNWRKYLLNQMPEYMVPTKIYQVRTNDRESNLPLHDETMRLHLLGKRKREAERQSKDPRDHIEAQLIQIWSGMLEREDIYINDDFFELGGNHILTLQLANKIQDNFNMSLEPETVYRKPTISELAVLIREAKHIKDRLDAVSAAEFVESFTQKMKAINKEALQDNSKLLEIQKGLSSRPKFFCVHGEDGDIAYLRHWIKYLGEQPFYAFQARTILDGKKESFISIEDIASNYLIELKAVQPRGPYYIGGFSNGGVIAFEMAQQLQKMGEQVALLGLIDSVNPIHNRKQSSFRDRFENLASAPASYLNGTLFKRLTGRGEGNRKENELDNITTQTVISPNFRGVIFENYLNELLGNYQITPFPWLYFTHYLN